MLALLQHGAKVEPRDYLEDKPLHEAYRERCEGVGAVVDLLLRWRADETALNKNRQNPEEMLDVKEDDGVDNLATQNETERTRLLRSRAPADRAWRRRGWLAMLRRRAEEDRSTDSGGGSEMRGHDPDGRAEDEGCKAARRRDEAGGGGDQVVADEHGCRGEWGDDKGNALSDVVALLVGLEPKGVFRTIVVYL